MSKIVKGVVLGLVLVPLAFLGGCAKKCGQMEQPRLEKMKEQYGGK